MFRRSLNKSQSFDTEIGADMTPMLDIVFILLIFFVVTTSFIKAEATEIVRPSNNNAVCQNSCPAIVLINIDQHNLVSINKRTISNQAIEANIIAKLEQDPGSSIIIRIHQDASNEALINAVDQVKTAGIDKVTVGKWQ